MFIVNFMPMNFLSRIEPRGRLYCRAKIKMDSTTFRQQSQPRKLQLVKKHHLNNGINSQDTRNGSCVLSLPRISCLQCSKIRLILFVLHVSQAKAILCCLDCLLLFHLHLQNLCTLIYGDQPWLHLLMDFAFISTSSMILANFHALSTSSKI